jgi:Leucine-rich repeat (LRR) protein
MDSIGNSIEGIPNFKSLTKLNLSDSRGITDLQKMTSLLWLDISKIRGDFITNESVKQLTNLTYLNILRKYMIHDEGIENITSLSTLIVCDKISNQGIQNLTNLTCLDLGSNSKINDEGLIKLTNLVTLELTKILTI